MRVLLTNPPSREGSFIREGRCTQKRGFWTTSWPPLSLATIAAVLEQDGHHVQLYDCSAEEIAWPDFIQRMVTFQPDLVIWSTGTPSIENDLSLAAEIKRKASHTKTAVFGTHVTTLAQECLEQTQDLDFIIRNEPEETTRALAIIIEKNISCNINHDSMLAAVAGISWRDSNHVIHHNPPRLFIQDLNRLPFPAWHLIHRPSYRVPLKGDTYLTLGIIRGCVYQCTFCTTHTYYGSRYRIRSIPSIIREIERNISEFGTRHYFIWADTFTGNKSFVYEFCETLIRKKLRIVWMCNSRVDTVDPKLLKWMRQAGCWMLAFGVESGVQDLLNQSKKGTRVSQVVPALTWARQAGIVTVGHFIFGLSGETQKSARESFEWITHLDIDLIQVYCAVPFPGSALYREALNKGWIDRQPSWSNFSQDKAILYSDRFCPEEAERWRLKTLQQFYFSWRRVHSIRNLLKHSKPSFFLQTMEEWIGTNSLFYKKDQSSRKEEL